MAIGSCPYNRVDPERQMEIVRQNLLGENSQDNAVAVARFALRNAGTPIQHENERIERTYTRKELSEMESKLDRLEILIIRKRAGEIISPEEINRICIRNEESAKETMLTKSTESADTSNDTKTESIVVISTEKETAETTEANEIIKNIEVKIEYAEVLLLNKPELIINSKEVSRKEITSAIEMIEQAELSGIDVEAQKKRLSDFIQKHSDIFNSI